MRLGKWSILLNLRVNSVN